MKASQVAGVVQAAAWLDAHYGHKLNRLEIAEATVGMLGAAHLHIRRDVLTSLAAAFDAAAEGEHPDSREAYSFRAYASVVRQELEQQQRGGT